MQLRLPQVLLLDTVLSGEGINDWLWDHPPEPIKVCAPDGPIVHAEPAALAAIAAWANYQREAGCTIEVDDSVKSPYAWRFGLLSALSGTNEGSTRAPRFLPPTRLPAEDSISHLLERAVVALGLSPMGSRHGLAKSVSEAVRNVFEHASAPQGAFVCASHFPTTDRLSFAVADTGVGVPATIRPRHGAGLSDGEANSLATELKITGARPSRRHGGPINNAGIGLFYLRTVSLRSMGQFALLSGTAFVRDNGMQGGPIPAVTKAPWRGTIVAVTLSASRADEIMHATHDIFSQGMSSNRKEQVVAFGPPPPDAERVEVKPTAVGLIEDKTHAKQLRDEVILPAIAARRPIGIDLRNGQMVTHSFVHALLYAAIREAGPDAKRLLFVHAGTNQVRDTVRLVAWDAKNGETSPQKGKESDLQHLDGLSIVGEIGQDDA